MCPLLIIREADATTAAFYRPPLAILLRAVRPRPTTSTFSHFKNWISTHNAPMGVYTTPAIMAPFGGLTPSGHLRHPCRPITILLKKRPLLFTPFLHLKSSATIHSHPSFLLCSCCLSCRPYLSCYLFKSLPFHRSASMVTSVTLVHIFVHYPYTASNAILLLLLNFVLCPNAFLDTHSCLHLDNCISKRLRQTIRIRSRNPFDGCRGRWPQHPT